MTRLHRAALACAAALFTTTSTARAQTPAASQTQLPHRLTIQIDLGATFGHTSDASVGGEADYAINTKFDGFIEGGHIGNAATSDFSRRASNLGAAVGASVSAVERVNFLDFGVRYRVPDWSATLAKVHPYVAGGIGFAQVKTKTTLSINGAAVVPESIGVQLGDDLSGTQNRPFAMLALGGTWPIRQRYFLDFGYRYGHAFKRTEQSELILAGVNTNRLQIGFGIAF